jgi:hypothetical protein
LALLAESGFLQQYHAKALEWRLIDDLEMLVNALATVDFVEDFFGITQTLLFDLN